MRVFRVALCVLVLVAMAAAAQAQGSGSLKVTSYPSGANVAIDGIDTGKTTPMSESLAIGQHTVTVSVPFAGWNPDTRTVSIVSGNNDLSVTLLPTLTTGPAGATGPQGPPGIPGPPGPPGADGATGPAGATGAAGADGAPGATGPQGPQGDTGPAGAMGPAGATGPQGPAGATGAQGPAGATGAQGPAGATGAQGPAGATGAQGPQGATGAQGPQGAQGVAGATGPQGPAGPAGQIDDPSMSCQVDEFMSGAQTISLPLQALAGTVGALGWTSNSAIQPNTDWPNPGVVTLSAPVGSLTSGNAFNHLRLWAGTNSVTPGPFYSSTPLRMKWILRRSTGTVPSTYRVGFTDDVFAATPGSGMSFEVRAGEWYAVTRGSSGFNDIPTGVLEAGNWQMLQIQRNNTTGAIEFYINGVLRASSTLNLPSQFRPLNLAIQLGGQGDVLIDYVSICLTGLQRNMP